MASVTELASERFSASDYETGSQFHDVSHEILTLSVLWVSQVIPQSKHQPIKLTKTDLNE